MEDLNKYIKARETLTNVKSTILTPNLKETRILSQTYTRYLFISSTIEYLAHLSLFYGINEVSGNVITEALTRSSIKLGNLPATHCNLLLYEMCSGLRLLKAKDLGTTPSPTLRNGKIVFEEAPIGFSYTLTDEGWNSYKKQEYQIALQNLRSTKLSRFTTYIATGIAIIALIISIFT